MPIRNDSRPVMAARRRPRLDVVEDHPPANAVRVPERAHQRRKSPRRTRGTGGSPSTRPGVGTQAREPARRRCGGHFSKDFARCDQLQQRAEFRPQALERTVRPSLSSAAIVRCSSQAPTCRASRSPCRRRPGRRLRAGEAVRFRSSGGSPCTVQLPAQRTSVAAPSCAGAARRSVAPCRRNSCSSLAMKSMLGDCRGCT